MSEPLTDQELIQLVQEKTAEELSFEEIERLRERLRASPALQQVMFDQLQLETYLGTALGRFEVSVDDIIRTSSRLPVNRLKRYSWWWLMLLVAIAIPVIYVANRSAPHSSELASNGEDATAVLSGTEDPPRDPIGKTPKVKPPGSSVTVKPPVDSNPDEHVPETTATWARTPDGRWRLEFEAENFTRGNVTPRDRSGGVCVITAKNEQAFVEYEIEVPQPGRYQFDFRYAAERPAPLRLLLNGMPVKDRATAETTVSQGGEQTWFTEGTFDIIEAKTVVRLEMPVEKGRIDCFPMLDKIAISEPDPNRKFSPKPWEATLLTQGKTRPFPLYELGAIAEQAGIQEKDLQTWFEPVAGQASRFASGKRGAALVASFEGMMRLRAPWVSDAVLRLSLFDHHGLMLHFLNGNEGITLQYYKNPRPTWTAYRVARSDAVPQPQRLSLLATDDGRYERTGSGPIELRRQDGMLVMSRGDVRLLTVPLPDSPAEVLFENKAWFHGISMYRGEPAPPTPANRRPYILRSQKPALMAWQRNLPMGAKIVPNRAGFLTLSTEDTTKQATVSVPVGNPGFQEVILQVGTASPGTGLYLADDDDAPKYVVRFLREERTNRNCFQVVFPGDLRTSVGLDFSHNPVPFAGNTQWLRLVLGHGSLKCWTSPDGVHWGRACDPLRSVRGGFSRIGLCVLPGQEPRQITLRQLEVRELETFNAIVPDDLRTAALSIPGDAAPENWLQTVLENQPPEADPVAWRQACALRTLSTGAGGPLGRILLNGLLAETMVQPLQPARRLALLEEASLIADTWAGEDLNWFMTFYELLGHSLIEEGHPRPYSMIGEALLKSPLWTVAPVQIMPEPLVRQELLQTAYEGHWEATSDLCHQLRFWNDASQPDVGWPGNRQSSLRLVEWAEGVAARHVPGRRLPESASPTQWRHPLVEELSKEGYNVLAEFAAALDGKAYQDACQIISAAGAASTLGLLPDAQDRRLMVSLPRAVSLAMREHLPLRETMIETFGATGMLRVRQAISSQDPQAVQSATVQFTGTEAASAAHLWLGDRYLGTGSFAQAVGQYQQAFSSGSPAQRKLLATRLRLAFALLGQNYGSPATEPVAMAGETLSAADFEALISDLRGSRTRVVNGPQTVESVWTHATLPVPAVYAPARRFPFAGDAGQNPGKTTFADVDVGSREFTLTLENSLLIQSNRFQITAFDTVTGTVKWAQGLAGAQGDARSWVLRGMKPILGRERVFARRLTKEGVELVCLDLATGAVQWTRRPGSHVLCDPMLVEDDLFMLTSDVPQLGLIQVSLTVLDPSTGEVRAQSSLLQLRDAWSGQVPCEAIAVTDKIVACVGGCVVCCDLFGQPRWLRRQTWLPPWQEATFFTQFRLPPNVQDGHVFVTQPGVLSVECLELESGRLAWQRVIPDIRRIQGISAGRAIIETGSGLMGLDSTTGRLVWEHRVENMLEAQVCSDEFVCYSQLEQFGSSPPQPCLVWLDPLTGREQARSPLPALQEKDPQLGPLLVERDRFWVSYARNEKDYQRELIELIPSASAEPGGLLDPVLARWTPHVDSRLQAAIGTRLPGWTLLTPQTGDKSGFQPTSAGEQDILVTRATQSQPVVLARRVQVGDEPTKFRLQVGLQNTQPWTLSVHLNGISALAQPIAAQADTAWQEYQVDLAQFAGKPVWIVVTQNHVGDGDGFATWKSLEIVRGK